MMKVDYLVLGAGLSGCVIAERLASVLGKRVLLVDRRDHVGGNAYDYYDANGILVHRYGPHIFHTNSEVVWTYLSRFTEWRPYEHRVLAAVDGRYVPVPFNLNALEALFPARQASLITAQLVKRYGFPAKVPILKLLEDQESGIREFAEYVYRRVFYGYTVKQWGITPEELSPSVTARVPVHISRDDRYFQDTYQAMPRTGYSEMFRRMIAHPNIHVLLKTDSRDVAAWGRFDRVVYTGPIDEYFGYIHGPLPYRSLRFELTHQRGSLVQAVGQINFPSQYEFTRTTEFRHLTGQGGDGTTIATEYPLPYIRGKNDPYYPVPREENQEIFARYQEEAAALKGRVFFAGRLADYRYYNMDQAVARALSLFEKEIVPLEKGADGQHWPVSVEPSRSAHEGVEIPG